MARRQPTILFLHIPKTAGSTLDQIWRRHIPEAQTYSLGADFHAGLTRFKQLSAAERASFRLVKGHMAFGLHHWIPGRATYVTFLRQPVERAISHYWFLYYAPNSPHYEYLRAPGIGPIEFLQSGLDPGMSNCQVRFLSGLWEELAYRPCAEEHLELAKRYLEQSFRVVGLTERFDESLLLLQDAFGWRPQPGWRQLRYTPVNVNERRPPRESTPAEVLQAFAQANELDLALYDYARQLFEQRLRACRRKQRLLSPFANAYWGIRRRSLRVYLRQQLARRRSGAR